jgi:hypothetical protein
MAHLRSAAEWKVAYFRPGEKVRIVETQRGYHMQTGVVLSVPRNPVLDSLAKNQPELDHLRVYEVQLDRGEKVHFTELDLELLR